VAQGVLMQKFIPVHDNDALRAARLGWNALLNLSKDSSMVDSQAQYIGKVMGEMNKNGLFNKPGVVGSGPILGDLDE